jgi:hypothetical protein
MDKYQKLCLCVHTSKYVRQYIYIYIRYTGYDIILYSFLFYFGYQNVLNLKSKFTDVNINTTYLYFVNESPSKWVCKISKYAGKRLNGFYSYNLRVRCWLFIMHFVTGSGKTWSTTQICGHLFCVLSMLYVNSSGLCRPVDL